MKFLTKRQTRVEGRPLPATLHTALLGKSRYDRVFKQLEKKAAESRRLADSFANHQEMTLDWVLRNRRRVTRWILANLRNRTYAVSPARESACRIGDKERILYRLEWPDRILQMVLAQVLSECWDTVFEDSLYSYRKGRSAVEAARRAARFIRARIEDPVYVLKRDVKSYGDSIPHDLLFRSINRNLTGADPFVVDLIRQFIAFPYVALDGREELKARGLPTGMPINCVLENLYLSPLDREMSAIPGVSYMRYGDDIWAAAACPDTAVQARLTMNRICEDLRLAWHPDKSLDGILSASPFAGTPPQGFNAVRQIPHLGIVIDRNGQIDIPQEKLRPWRDKFKVVLHRANYTARRLRFGPREKMRQLVHFANRFLNSTSGSFPKMDYLLTVVTEDRRFIELDRWIAETILAVHHGRYSKANFRKTPFAVLKSHGLESLYLRRQGLYRKAARRKRSTGNRPGGSTDAGNSHG